jgi:hypothetical protein
VLDTISDLVGKNEKIARKPWITQAMISKMAERKKRKNVNTEEDRKNYRRLRNKLKRATDNAKKEYLEYICNEIMEFQRTGRYDLMYGTLRQKNVEKTKVMRISRRPFPVEIMIDQKQLENVESFKYFGSM